MAAAPDDGQGLIGSNGGPPLDEPDGALSVTEPVAGPDSASDGRQEDRTEIAPPGDKQVGAGGSPKEEPSPRPTSNGGPPLGEPTGALTVTEPVARPDSASDGRQEGRTEITPLRAKQVDAGGGPTEELPPRPTSTADQLPKKRNRENYSPLKPTDTLRTEERFVLRTATADRRVEELLRSALDKWASLPTRLIIIASRFDPRPIAETLAYRLTAKHEYRVRVDGEAAFEESASEKLVSEYRNAPELNPDAIILETAREGYLSPGIDEIFTKTLSEFAERLAHLGLRVILALTINKPRGIALIRHSLYEVTWHSRWLDDLARRAQIPRVAFQDTENLLKRYAPDGTVASDERDHRIFAAVAALAYDAENKSVSTLKDLLRSSIEQAASGEIKSDESRKTFSALLGGTRSEGPDEVIRAMLLVTAFGNGPRVSDFRSLCETLIPDGPVDHIDQLPPGLREKAAGQLLQSQNNGEAFDLPSWNTTFRRAFDGKLRESGLKLSNGRVYFAERWSSINPREEILDHHPNLVREALDRVVARGALHELPLPLARGLTELFARSQQTLDEALLASALAVVPGRLEAPSDAAPGPEIIDRAITVAKWLGDTSRRLGELLAVFAAVTSPGNDPDHAFWRLVAQLRTIWRTDLISSQVLEGGLFVVLSRADSATAPALVNSIYDIFDRSADAGSRRLIVELMEGVADWACDTADARPEMWLHGFKSTLPTLRRPDYRAGIATMAVERIVQFDVRWRPGRYADLAPGTLVQTLFGNPDPSSAPLLDQNGCTIIDCVFGPEIVSLLKSQLALARLLNHDVAHQASENSVLDNVERRLRDVVWVLVAGISDDAFGPLKTDREAIFDELLALLAQWMGVQRPADFSDAANRIVTLAEEYSDLPQIPAVRASVSPWFDFYGLFRASILVHWRFLAFGHGAIPFGSPSAVRMAAVLDYLAKENPERLPELYRCLAVLKKASDHLVRIAGGRREAAAGSLYRDKALAIEKLTLAVQRLMKSSPRSSPRDT